MSQTESCAHDVPVVAYCRMCELYRLKGWFGPSLPPLWRRVFTYMKAWVVHQLHGKPPAPEAIVASRRAVCAACPHRTNEDTCAKCGCVLKSKIAWSLAACPLGKWPAVVVPLAGWVRALLWPWQMIQWRRAGRAPKT